MFEGSIKVPPVSVLFCSCVVCQEYYLKLLAVYDECEEIIVCSFKVNTIATVL